MRARTPPYECPHGFGRECRNPLCRTMYGSDGHTSPVSPFSAADIAAWAERADDYNSHQWENEELKFSKSLYVGNHTERDRRSIHGEAARGVKAARRFWESIPAEARVRVAEAADLPVTAIPKDLRP